MTVFNESVIQGVLAACGEAAADLASSLAMNLGGTFDLHPGEARDWQPDEWAEALDRPGVFLSIEVGGQGIACLIPESLPLPDWYTDPDATQESQLQTVPMEWAINLLPADIDAERTEAVAFTSLKDAIQRTSAVAGAQVIEIGLSPPESASDNAPSILIVLPLEKLPAAGAEGSVKPVEVPPAAAPPAAAPAPSPPPAASPAAQPSHRPNRLANVPVSVSVRLAETRIGLGQLLNIGPGSLIKFEKNCDALLELYVNNQRYCRGEAIKINENFGLRVRDIGVFEQRAERIFQI